MMQTMGALSAMRIRESNRKKREAKAKRERESTNQHSYSTKKYSNYSTTRNYNFSSNNQPDASLPPTAVANLPSSNIDVFGYTIRSLKEDLEPFDNVIDTTPKKEETVQLENQNKADSENIKTEKQINKKEKNNSCCIIF